MPREGLELAAPVGFIEKRLYLLSHKGPLCLIIPGIVDPLQCNVMLLGDYQHLAVELFRGRIRISYDIGNNPVSTMFSYEIMSDGKYHRVELLAVKTNFTLRVDGGLARYHGYPVE